MRVNNYVKLYIREAGSIYGDGEELCRSAWVFPFGDSGKSALKAAQEKRTEMRRYFPALKASAFQLSTFAPSSLRGVPVIGEPIRELKIVEAA